MSERSRTGEKVLRGIAVSDGVCRDRIIVLGKPHDAIPRHEISEAELPQEIQRLERALTQTRQQILDVQRKVANALGAKDASIFDAHLLVLDDPTLIDEVNRVIHQHKVNVEHAFQQVAEKYASTLSTMNDEYLRERAADMRDVTTRVLDNLLGRADEAGVRKIKEPCIIIAYDLSPSTTALLDKKLVRGFATDIGSKTSHTAIMARSLEIPAVVGLHDASRQLESGQDVLLDGFNGLLILNPTTLATNAQFGGLTTPPFAVNPSGLFWGNGAQIFTIPLSGGTTPVPVVNEYNGGYMLDDVTADDSHLYWTTNDGFVKRGSPDGTNVTVLGSSQDSPDNIVVNATHVYWTNRRLQDSQTSGIMRCDLDGRNLTTVGLGAAGALALSGTHAYWSDGAFLWRSSLDGTNPESITKGSASAIFPDASNVYWVGNSASLFGFFKAPLTGGPSSLVVVASSTAFVTDDQFIYYTVSSNNPAVQSGVMRIAK